MHGTKVPILKKVKVVLSDQIADQVVKHYNSVAKCGGWVCQVAIASWCRLSEGKVGRLRVCDIGFKDIISHHSIENIFLCNKIMRVLMLKGKRTCWACHFSITTIHYLSSKNLNTSLVKNIHDQEHKGSKLVTPCDFEHSPKQ